MIGEPWHEIAHACHSSKTARYAAGRDVAEQLLEDIRAERRLVAARPDARSWLRENRAASTMRWHRIA
jgi:hypothetical protein